MAKYMVRRKRPGVRPCWIAVAAALWAAPPGFAATITATSFANASTAADATGSPGYSRSWQTANMLGPVIDAAETSSFTSHFISNSVLRVEQPAGPNMPLVAPKTAAYDLLFTVADPDHLGYRLVIDLALRGYATVQSDNGVQVTASSGTYSGRIDTDMSDAIDTLGTQRRKLIGG